MVAVAEQLQRFRIYLLLPSCAFTLLQSDQRALVQKLRMEVARLQQAAGMDPEDEDVDMGAASRPGARNRRQLNLDGAVTDGSTGDCEEVLDEKPTLRSARPRQVEIRRGKRSISQVLNDSDDGEEGARPKPPTVAAPEGRVAIHPFVRTMVCCEGCCT